MLDLTRVRVSSVNATTAQYLPLVPNHLGQKFLVVTSDRNRIKEVKYNQSSCLFCLCD
jgi:hypothetical protein